MPKKDCAQDERITSKWKSRKMHLKVVNMFTHDYTVRFAQNLVIS